MQAVHTRVGVRPRIGQRGGVELAHELLHQRQLQQPRAARDEEADRVLDRGDIADQVELEDGREQIPIAGVRDPGVEGDEGRIEVQPDLATERDGADEILPRVTLVEDLQDAVVDRLDRAGDEEAARVPQRWQMRRRA